jgi:hypothetical protein
MANIFTYETQDIDLKDCIKLKTNCQQLDTIVLQFNVYNYDIPVDLTNFNIEFRAVKPDGTLYSQTQDIIKVSNLLTISCNNQLTSVNGRTTSELRIFDNLGNQKSSYFIVLNVIGIVSDEDKVISRTLIDSLEHLDNSINRAIEMNTTLDNEIDEMSSTINNLIIEATDTFNTLDNNANNTINTLDILNNDAKITQTNLNNSNIQAKNNIDTLNQLVDITNLAMEVYTARDGEERLNDRLERDKDYTSTQMTQILGLLDMLYSGSNICVICVDV